MSVRKLSREEIRRLIWEGALDLTRREALEVRFSIKIANI